MLLELVAAHMTAAPVEWLNQKPLPSFLMACRIICELQEPSTVAAPSTEANSMQLSIDDGTKEAAHAEGIDLEREIGVYDPRAFNPKCLHGRRLKDEPCDACTPPPGSAFEFKLGAEEQAALDAALAERRRIISKVVEPPGDLPELDRVPVRSVEHRDWCAAAFAGERRPDLQYPCTCDFGRRLAEEMGVNA